MATALDAAGDHSWAKLFNRALAGTHDQFMLAMGHSLALLLRRGPTDDMDVTKDELEQLLVDTVATWPVRRVGET